MIVYTLGVCMFIDTFDSSRSHVRPVFLLPPPFADSLLFFSDSSFLSIRVFADLLFYGRLLFSFRFPKFQNQLDIKATGFWTSSSV